MRIESVFGRRALEDYLKAIYRLEEVFGTARTNDIAQELGVSPSTVSKTIRRLAEEGYLVWNPYIGVKLDNKGREIVSSIVRRHRIAETFLYKTLKFDIAKAHIYAHAMEHLPEEIFDKLYEFLGKPVRCPHGNPIDPWRPIDMEDKPLTLFEQGTRVMVTRILCSFKEELIIKLHSLGIDIDREICVIEKKAGYMKISIRERIAQLTTYEATFIKGIEKGVCS